MNKVITCFAAGCLLCVMQILHARDNTLHFVKPILSSRPDTTASSNDTAARVQDSVVKVQDTAAKATDTVIKVQDTTLKVQDTLAKVRDTTVKDSTPVQPADTVVAKTDDKATESKSTGEEEGNKRDLDTRWFISPLLKFQFQDFSFLEVNRKGYQSDAYTLPFDARGNGSFAASAYKNLTRRLSVSADIGLSFGHVTNDKVLISQTKSKTYNLLNATFYYHLLGPTYRLQPYIAAGINDLINDVSYASAPVGLGAKFNSKKIMALAQVSYGFAVGKNISNSTMYSVGIYIPLRNKKKKQADADENSSSDRSGNKKKDDKKKSDTTSRNGTVIINNYINVNMDSILRAKGLFDDDGNGGSSGSRKRRNSGNGGGDEDNAADKEAFKDFNLEEDFASNDFKIDHIDGKPVVRFVVYFEFNEYSLNSKAFGAIDRVVGHLRQVKNMYIEIKGYTDNVGSEQYNNFLSRRRAQMVRDYINSRGVPSDMMKAKAYGSDNPVADNSNPNTAWLNRRAEIIVHLKQ